jgi:plasmid maintenance system antidote protein VapI
MSRKEKIPWSERVKKINEKYPSTASLDWYEVFRSDPTVMGKMVSDIIKISETQSSGPGKRPALDPKFAAEKYKQLSGQDYSSLPFKETFNFMKKDYSVRHLARKTSLDKSMVQRLLKGEVDPSVEIMEKIAKGFGKKPSFFLEYRIYYVLGMLHEAMLEYPDFSIVQYNKLKGKNEGLKNA